MHVSSVICFAICLSIQPCIIFAYEVFTFLFITKNNSIVFFWTRGTLIFFFINIVFDLALIVSIIA